MKSSTKIFNLALKISSEATTQELNQLNNKNAMRMQQ